MKMYQIVINGQIVEVGKNEKKEIVNTIKSSTIVTSLKDELIEAIEASQIKEY